SLGVHVGTGKLGILCALLAVTVGARAWDHVAKPPGNLPSDFFPAFVSAPDVNGFWSYGYDNQLLVRYSNAGSPVLVRYPQSRLQADYVHLAAKTDGGVVLG